MSRRSGDSERSSVGTGARRSDDSVARVLDDALAILAITRDVVEARVTSPQPPEWARSRGWDDFLLELSDHELAIAEEAPARFLAERHDAPTSLRALGAATHGLVARFESASVASSKAPERHVKKRKSAQLEALADVARSRFPHPRRIVDFGAGHGHLTRALFRELEATEALGIDWDPDRIARANELAGGPRFVHGDATQDERALHRGDLVVGLHPCGALGDALVERARDAHAHVLAVSCCFQKIGGTERHACSAHARAWDFVVSKHALGLANLSPVSFDGSGDLEEKRARRTSRHALRRLLEARGLAVEPGEEARGVPKDRVRRGLAEIAALSFRARGLDAPSARELADAEAHARVEHDRIARLSLPRNALGRVLELAIVLDRARLLEEAGFDVEVAALFSPRTSPRNLGIVALAP